MKTFDQHSATLAVVVVAFAGLASGSVNTLEGVEEMARLNLEQVSAVAVAPDPAPRGVGVTISQSQLEIPSGLELEGYGGDSVSNGAGDPTSFSAGHAYAPSGLPRSAMSRGHHSVSVGASAGSVEASRLSMLAPPPGSMTINDGGQGTDARSIASTDGTNMLISSARHRAPPVTDDNDFDTSPVPEPQTYALMLLGVAALGAARRRSSRP